MPTSNLRALYVSLVLYLLVSPISTYNTLAMLGLVASPVLVVFQISMTIVMIVFAIIASQPISRDCLANPNVSYRVPWIIGFWVIGPPMLFAYYKLRYRIQIELAASDA